MPEILTEVDPVDGQGIGETPRPRPLMFVAAQASDVACHSGPATVRIPPPKFSQRVAAD